MEPLTRDQALEKYARNANTIQLLEREQADLKKIIFSTVIKTSEPRLSPQTTRKTGVMQHHKQEIVRVLKELGGPATAKEIKELGDFSFDPNAIHNVDQALNDLRKASILNKEGEYAGKYSLAVHADNGASS